MLAGIQDPAHPNYDDTRASLNRFVSTLWRSDAVSLLRPAGSRTSARRPSLVGGREPESMSPMMCLVLRLRRIALHCNYADSLPSVLEESATVQVRYAAAFVVGFNSLLLFIVAVCSVLFFCVLLFLPMHP